MHEHVKQELVVVPLEESLPATYAAIKREQAKSPKDFKGECSLVSAFAELTRSDRLPSDCSIRRPLLLGL